MSKRFTLTECYELLQADPKTFRRWLKKAGMHEQVKSQISKADDRVKYLTQEQLTEIAALHERQLPLEIIEAAQLEEPEEIAIQAVESVLAEDIVELQEVQAEEFVAQIEEQVEDEIIKPHKKSEQHTHKEASKKFSIKPGTYKLIVDQLDELQHLHNESANLTLATQKLLDEQEKAHQQALEQLQASAYEKIAALETTIQLQQEQFEVLAAKIGIQSNQFDQYKISLTDHETIQTQQLHALEEVVTQSQQHMDRSLKTLRSDMLHQKEQVQAALLQTQQEIQAQVLQQHNEHQVEIHTLGEQVNGHIIVLTERLNATTEQLQKELHEEIDARKQLAKQVSALNSSRPATNNKHATTTKAANQPAATTKEEQ